jgi:succinylglutamic semialdehyde dehydrogenase
MTNGTLFIDGQWLNGQGQSFTSQNPATDEIIWQGHSADDSDVDKAVLAATDAFENWALTPLEGRVAIIRKYQSLLDKNKGLIAELISEETGKPLWEAKTEAAAMVGKINLSLTAHEDRTSQRENEMPGAVARLRHKPHGVVAVFGPFNFPGHLPNGHIVPALLAGNTLVFKPSEQTPRIGQKMVELWQNAGLPDGVLNLVQGARDTGIALSTHSDLDGLFFTGSSRTGALLHSEFAGHPEKILALEMGGNNPLIVTDISDLQGAVYHTLQSAFITAGQRCTCARRLIIPIGVEGDAFVDALQKATAKIKVGPQEDDTEPFMGSVISNTAADQLLEAQANLIETGGKSVCEMKRVFPAKPFLRPGIIDVTDIEHLPDEEYFGPLLQVIRVADFDAAIKTANDTRFGLSAGLISDNKSYYEKFSALSRAGIVNWNRPITGASGAAPFGGIGASGNHRPSAYYAADYCAYPVASVEAEKADLPDTLTPGITL